MTHRCRARRDRTRRWRRAERSARRRAARRGFDLGRPSGPTSGARARDPTDLGALLGLSIAALLVGEVGGVTTCPWAGLVGHPCPGCGLTRATWALLTGRLADAVALHPFVLLALPALGAALVVVVLRRAVAETHWLASPWLVRVGERTAVAIALAMVTLWIARFLGACGGPVAVDPWLR